MCKIQWFLTWSYISFSLALLFYICYIYNCVSIHIWVCVYSIYSTGYSLSACVFVLLVLANLCGLWDTSKIGIFLALIFVCVFFSVIFSLFAALSVCFSRCLYPPLPLSLSLFLPIPYFLSNPSSPSLPSSLVTFSSLHPLSLPPFLFLSFPPPLLSFPPYRSFSSSLSLPLPLSH